MDPSFFVEITQMAEILPLTTGVVVAAVLAALLLIVSGLASGSEIAIFSLSPTDVSELDPEKRSTDEMIQCLREDSERTLATILIANNFVNVTIIMLFNYVFSHLVVFKQAWVEFLCITVLLTFILLLFGEIIPKVFARQNSLSFCRRVANSIMFFRKLFWPMENVLLSSGFLAERVLQPDSHILSVDDLEQALELTGKEEIKDDQRMLRGIIRFSDETVKEVMPVCNSCCWRTNCL
jgi:CBS domain containing-hemolysin-like protein